jgi:hypothetical protein
MGGEQKPCITIFQLEQFAWPEIPEHDEVVLGVKRIVETHRTASAVRGVVRGCSNTDSQNDCGREHEEAGQYEQGQATVEIGIIVVHAVNESDHRWCSARHGPSQA